MTTSRNAANITSRRPWWNFTLRELLLLMVAVGACIALFQKEYYPRQLSPFITNLRMEKVIRKVVLERNSTDPLMFVTNGVSERRGNGICIKEGPCHLDPKLAIPATFMRDLQDALGEKLVKDGCRINSRSSQGSLKRPVSFDFMYQYRNNVGIVTVRLHPAEGAKAAKVYVTCYEISRPTQ